jgi:hypothetical protein
MDRLLTRPRANVTVADAAGRGNMLRAREGLLFMPASVPMQERCAPPMSDRPALRSYLLIDRDKLWAIDHN